MKKNFSIFIILIIIALFSYTIGYVTTATTTNLSLVKPAEDDDSVNWFSTMNDNLDLIDAAFDDLTAYMADLITADDFDDDDWGDMSVSTNSVTLDADVVDSAEIADNAIDSEHYTDDSIDNAHINWADIDNLGDEGAVTLATTATHVTITDNEDQNEENEVPFIEDASVPGNNGLESDSGFTYNPSTGKLTATGFVGALTGNADTCTTASAGDAAEDFFGENVSAVTDATVCTDIEGDNLSITDSTLNVTGLDSDDLSDVASIGMLDEEESATALWSFGNGVNVEVMARFGDGGISHYITVGSTGNMSLEGSANIEGVDATEFGYLDGVTSDVQTQLTAKMEDLVDDTTPELGGELDAGANSIGFTLQTVAEADGTTTIDWKDGNHCKVTLGAQAETFTFTAPSNPCNLTLIIVQDATGGRDITWPGTVKWLGTEATWTDGGASKGIVVGFIYDGTNYWGQATPWES